MLGRTAVTGLSISASQGNISATGVISQAIITEAERSAYETALAGVRNASYYTAKDLFEDNYAATKIKLDVAVDSFVIATAALAEVEVVQTKAEAADTTEEQLEVQSYIASNEVEVTQQEVKEYNAALNDVETYAIEAGAFLAASKNNNITYHTTSHNQRFNESMNRATVSYTAANNHLLVSWGDNSTIGFYNYMAGSKLTVAEVYGEGEEFYNNNGYYVGENK